MLNKFATNLKAIIGTVGQDQSHNHRYINLDGTPYGSSGLARVMMLPGLQANVALAAGIGALAGKVLHLPVGELAASNALWSLPGILLTHYIPAYLLRGPKLIIDRKPEQRDQFTALMGHQVCRAHTYGSFFVGFGTGLVITDCISSGALHGVLYSLRGHKIFHGKWAVLREPPAKRVRKPKVVNENKRTRKVQPAFG